MKNLKYRKCQLYLKSILIPSIAFLFLLVIFLIGTAKVDEIRREQELLLAQASLEKAIIQCYANEGFYPTDISYLKENYRLRIDTSKYNVFYECFSSNIIPDYGIYKK